MELRVAAEDREEEGVRPLILSGFGTSVGGREGGREGRGEEGEGEDRSGGRGRSCEQVGMDTIMWSTTILR